MFLDDIDAVKKQLRECEKKGVCVVEWPESHKCLVVFFPTTSRKNIRRFCAHVRSHYGVRSIFEFRAPYPREHLSPTSPTMTTKTKPDCTGISLEFESPDYSTTMFEHELENDPAILQAILNHEWATLFYQSITNMQWKKGAHVFSPSFRYSAAMVARLRNKNEHYMEFYGSGNEGRVDVGVEWHLNRLGWYASPHPE